MNLPLMRGRELKPPLRRVEPGSNASLAFREADEIPKIGRSCRKPVLRFPVNPDTKSFYRRFFPGTSAADWNDWHWQFQARIKSLADLERVFVLSADEREAATRHSGSLPVGITPYYASLMSRENASEP